RLAEFEKAETQLNRAQALALSEYGAFDPRTLAAIHELGLLATLTERYSESEELLRDAFDGRQLAFGKDNLATIESQFALAIAIGEQGRYDEVEVLFVDVLERANRVLGPDHPRSLVMARGLGVFYLSTGNMEKALPLLEDIYIRMRSTIGVENPATLLAMQDLANVLRSQRKNERA